MITFVGVLMTLIAAHIRMRTELKEASTQANIEREQTRDQAALDRKHSAEGAHTERVAATRRVVYLEAADELTKGQMFLGSLAKQDLTNLDYGTGMGGLIAAVNKVAIVGDMGTVKKARELVSLMNRNLFKGLAQLLPLTEQKNAVVFHDGRVAAAQSEVQRILAAMVNHNESMKNDPQGFAALQRSFDIQQTHSLDHTTAAANAKNAIADMQQAYAAAMVQYSKEVMLQLDELACAVRAELGIATDFQAFRDQTLVMQAAIDASVAELMVAVKNFREVAARPTQQVRS